MFHRVIVYLIVLALVVPAALWLDGRLRGNGQAAKPLPVPDGDVEFAWIHTSTSASSWERFVLGVQRLAREGFEVDDSKALLEETTSVPEIIVSRPGRPGRALIRWYKLSSEAGFRHWVNALAARSPAPLALIGGGSSDRAVELAKAMQLRKEWKGARPLLFLTTATADEVRVGDDYLKLTRFYPDRTFRFCFSNRRMAEAVMEFVETSPVRRAVLAVGQTDPLGAATAGAVAQSGHGAPHRYAVWWKDDPYSMDLLDKFQEVVSRQARNSPEAEPRRLLRLGVPYSVGTFNHANPAEEESVRELMRELPKDPAEKCILILPTVAAPARRVLRSLTGDEPLLGKRLTVVTGDAIPFNTFYRDGDFAWNVRDIPVPVVSFLHQNPVGWEPDGPYALQGPGSTEDILLYQDMMRRVLGTTLPAEGPNVADADELREKLKAAKPAFFDDEGDRVGGRGEHIIVFEPVFLEGGRVSEEPRIVVWKRGDDGKWELVRRLGAYEPGRKAGP